jgi:hypothetical protein
MTRDDTLTEERSGLQSADASVRSNYALALYYLSDDSQSSDRAVPRVDIRAVLPALIVALVAATSFHERREGDAGISEERHYRNIDALAVDPYWR